MRKAQDPDPAVAAVERIRSACAVLAGIGAEHIPIGHVLDLLSPAGQWKTLGEPGREMVSRSEIPEASRSTAAADPMTGCMPVTAGKGFRAADA